jgi:hypothetical protein
VSGRHQGRRCWGPQGRGGGAAVGGVPGPRGHGGGVIGGRGQVLYRSE